MINLNNNKRKAAMMKQPFMAYAKIIARFISLERTALMAKPQLNPNFVTGFVDGEGSFGVQCVRSSSNLLG